MRKLLLASYWVGIIADAMATVMLYSPTVVKLTLQPAHLETTPIFLYVSRIAGALMLGWTLLLYWAKRRPIERADILLFTLFPVVTILAIAAILVIKSNEILIQNMIPMLLFYVVLFSMYIPSYIWAKKQQQ